VTPIASRIAALIADEEYELIGPLMESLETDLLLRDDQAVELLGVTLHTLDAAIEHARSHPWGPAIGERLEDAEIA